MLIYYILGVVAVLLCAIVGFVCFGLGVSHRKKIAENEIGSAEEEAKEIIQRATKEGENKKRELMLEAKEENHKARQEADKEIMFRYHWFLILSWYKIIILSHLENHSTHYLRPLFAYGKQEESAKDLSLWKMWLFSY